MIRGPAKVNKYYYQCRAKGYPQSYCAAVAWTIYCKYVNPEYPGCGRSKKRKRKKQPVPRQPVKRLTVKKRLTPAEAETIRAVVTSRPDLLMKFRNLIGDNIVRMYKEALEDGDLDLAQKIYKYALTKLNAMAPKGYYFGPYPGQPNYYGYFHISVWDK